MARHSLAHEQLKAKRESATGLRVIAAAVAVIIIIGAFLGGFLLRGNQAMLKQMGFESFIADDVQNPGETVSGDTRDSISARVAEVQGILDDQSMDSYDLGTATTDTLGAFTGATKDPYVSYLDPETYKAYSDERVSTYGGIGVLFGDKDAQAYATEVFEGSVAQAAGVITGDYVVSVDGDESVKWTSVEVVNAITSREVGSSIVIKWRRPATQDAQVGEEFTTTLSISDYSQANIETEISDDHVGYIKIAQFNSTSASIVKEAILSLKSQGALAYVVDIRSNPGGYLAQAIEVASYFVPSGVVVEVETASSKTTKSVNGDVVTDAPLVVLCDGATASAAEVLASAVKSYGVGTLVGETTQGKSSIQRVRELSFGGALRYTVGYYNTPSGHAIDGVGVSPDIEIPYNGDAGDNQKDYAFDVASSLIPASDSELLGTTSS